MAILNVTPDSFSDGGRFNDLDLALKHAEALVAAGADMLDIGGESTRPGAAPVAASEEIERTAPVIEALRQRFDVPISIDTTKALVAEAALEAGADIINDVSAMRFDPAMRATAARSGAGVALMHMRGTPESPTAAPTPHVDVVSDVATGLELALQEAIEAGVDREAIALDPGFGFGKTLDENYELARGLGDLHRLGQPLLVGVSRKRMVRAKTGDEAYAIEHGNSAFHTWACLAGASVVRVHDVVAARAALGVAGMLRS